MQEILPIDPPKETERDAMVRLIADRLQRNGPLSPDDREARDRALLERALAYVAEQEQRIAAQESRIAYLQGLSMTDELTGLLNRRGFVDQLARALASARRYGHEGLVLYCDLDGFKDINDTYGHAAGDAALVHVAGALRGSVRACDLVARLGGDEFALALVHTSWRDGAKRARTLQWMVEREPLALGGRAMPLRISIGEHPFRGDDTVEDLICRADMAMYYAKRQKAGSQSWLAAE